MGMPATNKRVWTADEVRRLNEQVEARGMLWPRYELIDGELLGGEMTPAPSSAHQEAVRAFLMRLASHVERMGIGRAYTGPADIRLGPDRVVQPDVFVVRTDAAGPVAGWQSVSTLALAIEVLSPHSARDDRIRKRRLYQSAGVEEYWIVDVNSRSVERWRPNDERPEVLDREVVWQPIGANEPLVIDLEALFVYVTGDDGSAPEPAPPT